MTTFKCVVCITILTLVSSFTLADPVEEDFDILCGVFTEGLELNTSPYVAGQYIGDNARLRLKTPEVLGMFDAINQVEPADRYNVVQSTVEVEFNKSWDCPAMKYYLGLTRTQADK